MNTLKQLLGLEPETPEEKRALDSAVKINNDKYYIDENKNKEDAKKDQ